MATYYIDALNSGYRWNSSQPLETPISLTYAIPNAQPSYYSTFQAYPGQHQDGIRDVLEHVENLTNISFTEVATAEQAHLAFSYENLSGNVVGSAYYPYNSQVGYLSGDVFIDTRYQNDPAMGAGDQQYTVVLHEVGHALGLKHPFSGSANLPASEDNQFYSVMSYNWVSSPYVETFSIYDIATLQYLYGANLGFNAGDTVYDLSDYLGSRQTLWDGGGIDELDGSALSQDLVLSLNAGSFIDLDVSKNLAIALDVTIEKASGGSGNDEITGNDADNVLLGNAGDDLIEGGRGDDTLDGGTGFDTLLYRSLFGDFDFSFLTPTELTVTSTAGVDWGRDLVVDFELFQFTDVSKTFDEIYDAFWSPGPQTDISLALGILEQGQYGNLYAGQVEPDGQVTATFDNAGTNLTLSLTGYDIDLSDEVEVSLNGSSLGFLTPGPNEGLNGGDSFAITASQQQAGENLLTFSQALNPNYKWGLTDILLEAGLPTADFAITPGIVESGEYGNLYAGQVEPDGEVTATFAGAGTDLTLSLIGYDIDLSDEVEVLLNGSTLGFLTPGANEKLNSGDSFVITASQQQAGTNLLTFSQALNPSYKWGVTDILLEQGLPDANIALTVGSVESGQYGNLYAGQLEPDGQVTASFLSTGNNLTLSLTGYDIDLSDEVEVLLNGSSLSFLTPGPNEGLNGGDSIAITASQQQAGENLLTFSQALNPNYKWGVTDLLLEEGLLAADFALTPGSVESGQYGNLYAGQLEPDGEVTATFVNAGTDLTLSLTGYDIDLSDEVEVSLNGTSLGFLTPGPNEELNGGDSFSITASQQQAGENLLTFSQALNPSYKWGVTDILLAPVDTVAQSSDPTEQGPPLAVEDLLSGHEAHAKTGHETHGLPAPESLEPLVSLHDAGHHGVEDDLSVHGLVQA